MRSRKPLVLGPAAMKALKLQWGRDLAVTETENAREITRQIVMLQWGRDLAVTETCSTRPCARPGPRCFNGAVTLRSRKP